MGQKEKQQRYEEYIRTVSTAAAAIGRRKPYSMGCMEKHKETISALEEQEEGQGKEQEHDSAGM